MRTAVISDVHGNLQALDAVLAEVRGEGCDEIVCLGDLALLGPQPAECVDRLRALGDAIRYVRGNTDRMLAERVPDAPIEWCLDRLGDERVSWLGSLPFSQVLASADALCVHGSPRSDEERLPDDATGEHIDRVLAGIANRVLLHGHTHVQYRAPHAHHLVGNPGSVGFPFDGDQRAAWALVEDGNVNLRRTSYPIGDTITLLEASDNPARRVASRRLREAAE